MGGLSRRWIWGVLGLVCAATAQAGTVGADGWEQIADKEGVRVYRRSVAGSPLKSMKGVGVVDAPVATVALVLLDDNRAAEWVDSLAESRVVRTVSPHEYIEYNHVKMPWPVRDREFVTHVQLSVDPATRTAYIKSAPASNGEVARRAKIIRGELTSYYELKAIDGGQRTLLSLELNSDPKGSLPAWVVNLFQKDWARETMRGIRKQVKKPDLTPPSEFATYLGELAFGTPASR
jgi:START domain